MNAIPAPTDPLRTPRLWIRRVTPSDAPFFLALLNSPGWLRFIGDRNVHTLEEAADYIRNRILPGYTRPGYGSFLVGPLGSNDPAGFVGVFERESLSSPDFGFAFLPAWQGVGYAFEASQALLQRPEIEALPALLAISLPDNERSIRLLRKLGFVEDGTAESGEDTLLRFRRRKTKIAAPRMGAAI